MSVNNLFDPLFQPRTIAVVGASATNVSGGNRYIKNLQAFGYQGQIWPIHPKAQEIEGLKAYASLADTPDQIDYLYVAVNATLVVDVLRSARGRVKIAQVMSSGFSETEGGRDLERQLLDTAREVGVRVIGPNCLGAYSPKGKVTFTAKADPAIGRVAVLSQSGGLGVDIIRRGKNRGVKFAGVVTVGNCTDVKPWEVIQYFLENPDVDVIGLYLETAMGGRELFETLRFAKLSKPVVLLKGGATRQGQLAALSHTGALAGSDTAWNALAKQTGLARVNSLNQFIDTLVMMQSVKPSTQPTERIILFGNGGGASVLGTDAFGRFGFDLVELAPSATDRLNALALPPGSSVLNPIDVPAGALQQDEGRIAEKILQSIIGVPGVAIVIHINMTVVLSFKHVDMLGNLVKAVMRVKKERPDQHVLLVLRSDGDPEVEEKKRAHMCSVVEAGIPVFHELDDAAAALASLRAIERHAISIKD